MKPFVVGRKGFGARGAARALFVVGSVSAGIVDLTAAGVSGSVSSGITDLTAAGVSGLVACRVGGT